MDDSDRSIIGLGTKGLMYAELTARGSGRDLHSGMAPIIQNPAWRLVGALSVLAGNDGRILVPHWYDDALPLNDAEKGILDAMPYDDSGMKRSLGVERFVKGQDLIQAKRDLAGIWSGYTGEGAKTILPAWASAKLDMRLIPGMIPHIQRRRLRDHLSACGYDDIEVTVLHTEPGARTSPDDPFVGVVRGAVNDVYGSHVLSIIYPETGPVWYFFKELGAPFVLVGGTHIHSNIHSLDEYAHRSAVEYVRNNDENNAKI